MTRRTGSYFEPLTAEDVLEIIHAEQANGTLHGVIVQFGGQTPLKLAGKLHEAGVPILGTTPDAIDLAEDRDRFSKLIRKLKLRQPENGIATLRCRGQEDRQEDRLSRSSSAPPMCWVAAPWKSCAMMPSCNATSPRPWWCRAISPVLIDSYLSNAIEVDVDVIAMARMSSSPASWSISRRRASIRVTAPVRCRPIRSSPP